MDPSGSSKYASQHPFLRQFAKLEKNWEENVIRLPLSSQKCNRTMPPFFRFYSRDKGTSTIDALFGKNLKKPDIGLEGKKP
ncbi:hypothetical protein CDAR_197851 [Caerostris darwini]|uniref:Uncharacterized protein n=1 Tax=Caerostris darwini TaxID=1538125 RepID=A0AAV4SBQ0_9ARAC|nr:hypothetical protein CDAR_197851 [Caerostris darwini]